MELVIIINAGCKIEHSNVTPSQKVHLRALCNCLLVVLVRVHAYNPKHDVLVMKKQAPNLLQLCKTHTFETQPD